MLVLYLVHCIGIHVSMANYVIQFAVQEVPSGLWELNLNLTQF